ncbi:hypothetical protein BDB00DRAFT_231371 [Zychaea mexicana]|uniref:uncharacterized protein n=1 Tax=Zychaea mexicana TaxID=64656 RepID=UPI0022FDE8C9|nr:uncharacterized protein BDB00DRAFT_231371 [Zychaea mexicana]KAI9499373.1 hypothetical protein BDB00DRAFT_231371 [Zychaea mexicana]
MNAITKKATDIAVRKQAKSHLIQNKETAMCIRSYSGDVWQWATIVHSLLFLSKTENVGTEAQRNTKNKYKKNPGRLNAEEKVDALFSYLRFAFFSVMERNTTAFYETLGVSKTATPEEIKKVCFLFRHSLGRNVPT